jgi:hypothetical protein
VNYEARDYDARARTSSAKVATCVNFLSPRLFLAQRYPTQRPLIAPISYSETHLSKAQARLLASRVLPF